MSIDGDAATAGQSWTTPAELAQMVGVGQAAVLNRLRRGTLRGEKRGGRWQIPPEVVDAVVAAYRAQAVSSGNLRLLRRDEEPVGEEVLLTDSLVSGRDVEALQRLLVVKDELIAAKEVVINELRRELAQHRSAMVVLLGGAPATVGTAQAAPNQAHP